ncbi:MAG: D-alanyl-D-alanine carboxypeptidase [Desulfosarcinaceae bacterium]
MERKIAPLLGKKDAVMICAPDGRTLAALNINSLLVPASTLKVLTCLAAFHYLGDSYRFPTEFYLSPDTSLILKGYGDPLLVSERLQVIGGHLATRLKTVHDLVLDASFFAQPIVIPGRGRSNEPYDAPNGALCVNFNTVSFKRRNRDWASAEPQTPLLPSAIPAIEASGLKEGRITLAGNSAEAVQYAGELIAYFLNKAGVAVTGEIKAGKVDPDRDRLLWRYRSPDELEQVAVALLEFSNNFIANQLMLAMGARAFGPPATVDKGMQALREYYRSTLGLKSGTLVEASGISRDNRISARTMMILLDRFTPYRTLMRHAGRQWYKTGHLNGIRSRVGYLDAAGGGHYRFVVMLNTPGRTTDRIMRILEKDLD